ncbi:MAG: class I SAM-dependent methyltransferase [Phycisphaeraceae bacterium]|nr:MAG: class I SAM-dependent methyltransferase [Phycisphaeraceae bacterium]
MSDQQNMLHPGRLGPGRLARLPLTQRFATRFAHALLGRLEEGELTLETQAGRRVFGEPARDGLCAQVRLRDDAVLAVVAMRGALGAAETYIAGLWECDDLTALVRILVRNQAALEAMDHRWSFALKPLRLALDRLRPRGRGAARRDIHAHYDLGNEFFALFLDPSMTYSCAIFDRPGMTLEEASIAKIDRACAKLDLRPGDHLLEIGTGWGSMAIHAAREYGCRVTTTTISKRQAAFAHQRIEEEGLGDRITVLERDFRDLEGVYDKLVSIEMIEAVGAPLLGTYVRKCGELLKPDGAMLLQSITIDDRHYERAKSRVDFLKKYIFPGSFLPSVSAISTALARESDLRVGHLEDIGLHYAATLRQWRENFGARLDEARALGLDEPFIRMWMWYFCYCEGTFAERRASDVQMLLLKPRCGLEWPLRAHSGQAAPAGPDTEGGAHAASAVTRSHRDAPALSS